MFMRMCGEDNFYWLNMDKVLAISIELDESYDCEEGSCPFFLGHEGKKYCLVFECDNGDEYQHGSFDSEAAARIVLNDLLKKLNDKK